ncbi:hypothetical protein GCM10023258_20440 [Terrabacter aeriphilus]|uniref:Lipoprotein LpqN n=1 Tax=Terrabacter aeriphilus TaxID=515662 RepID=A0ABP9JBL5_9MICO
MTALPTRVLSVGALTCALVLTGCSKGTTETAAPPAASSTTASAAPSTTPSTTGTGGATADGDEVRGRAGSYTVVPPEGWAEATSKADGVADIDLVLLSSKKVDGFANNLVVLKTAGDRSVLDGELAKGKEQMSAAGRTVAPAPAVTVGGVAAEGFTTTFEQQGVKVTARSFGVQRDGSIYLLTLSSSQGDADHAMDELEELLSSWTWS